jgi:hypothetical protein
MTVTPLADKDRIFTNVYGFQSPDLKAAQARGDWDKTLDLIKLGEEGIIEIVKASGLRGRGGAPDRDEVELHAQGAQAGQTQFPGDQRRRERAGIVQRPRDLAA